MPDLVITDPKSGKKLRLTYTGDPPSDQDIAEAFDQAFPPQQPAAAKGAPSATPPSKPAPWGIHPLDQAGLDAIDNLTQAAKGGAPSYGSGGAMGVPDADRQMQQMRAADPNAGGNRRPYLPSPTEKAVTGALLTAGRQIVPTAASLQAGALVTGATSELSPFVSIPAGLLTMFATNYLANKAQDAAAKPLFGGNLFDAAEREQEQFRREHPIGALVAENAPGLLFGKPVSPARMFSKAGVAPAALGAGVGLGAEGYAQIQAGKFDPARLAGSAAIGATLSGEPTVLGHQVMAPAEAAGAGLRTSFTRPERAPVENPTVAPAAPTIGTVRYTQDMTPVRVIGQTDNGRLRVRVGDAGPVSRVTPDEFLAKTQELNGGPSTHIGIQGRDDLAAALQQAMGLPADQAGQVADRYHAVALEEARRTGTPVAQWYQDRIAGITAGGEQIARDLMAQAGKSKAEIDRAARVGELPQGAVTFTDPKGNGWRAVVSALVNPDATTGYHELGHIVRRMLTPAENDVVGAWAGAQKLPDGSWQYPVAAEEKFADAVEAVETQRAATDAKYASVPPALRKVANAFRWIADRVTQAVPGLARVKGVDASPLNPDIVKLIRARFGEGKPSGRTANIPDLQEAQGRAGATGAAEAAGTEPGGVPEAGGAGGGAEPGPFADLAREPGPDSGSVGRVAADGSGAPGAVAQGRQVAPPIEYMNPDELGVLPGIQFKREITDSKNAVTDQLKGQREYNAYDGGVLTVYEDANGKRYAVDGHHRRELAQRAERFVMPGPDGKPTPAPRQIAVQVLRSADGWTPETAKAYAVRRNLLEGKGRAVDAADALTTLAGRDAARAEVAKLPKSALTRDTAGLVELDPTGRELVLNRKVDPSVAAGIGKALPGDPARQKIALDLAAGRSDLATYDDGVTLGREVQAEDVVSGPNAVQLGLEGMDTPSVRSTAAERALLKKDVLAKAVAEQRNAKAGLGLDLLPGETIDETARKAIATEIGENRGQVSEKVGAALTFDAQVQETLRATARELAEGKITRADAARRVYDVTVESAKRPIAEIVGGKPGGASDVTPAGKPVTSTPPAAERVSVVREHASDGPERPLQVGDVVSVIRAMPDGNNRIGQRVSVKARLIAEHTLPDGARGFEYEYNHVRGGGGPRQTRTGFLREDAGKWQLVERAPEVHTPGAEEEQTPLFKEPRPAKNREVIEQLERVPFVPAETVAHALGDKPEYLNDILRFMNDKRQKVVEGTLNGRDVAKAYFTTLASQGAGAMRAERLQAKLKEQGIDLPLPEQFLGRSKTGAVTVRPEDAAAAWLATPKGQRALDAIEHGEFDPEAWAEGFAIRRAFGDDRFAGLNAAGQTRPGAVNFRNLSETVDAINAAKGDPAKIGEALGKLNGIGPGKLGFVKHLVGFGDAPTIDARQVNVWLTGKGRIAGDRSEGAQAARMFKRSQSDQRVSRYMAERVSASLESLRDTLPALAEVPKEAAGHILHQWVWDRAAQASDTPLHHHAGLYEAVTLFQSKQGRPPKVGDSLTGKDGNTYRIDAVDAAKGTAKVTILDKDGKVLGRIPAAPLDRWIQEKRAFDSAQRSAKIRGTVSDVVNAPRTLQASMDLSAPLRQGAILSAAEPKLAARAFGEMFRALSTKNHEQIVADLAARPNAALYDQFKLYLSTRKGGPLAGKEEAYLSNLVGKLPLIKHSEQAYTAFLDVLRADVFDKYVAALKAQGLTPEKNAKDFEDVAKFINSATGRGELPHFLKDSGDLLNGLFFSPRYAMSRLEVMNPATYAKMTPAARKIALTAALKFAGLTAMTLTLLKAGGAEVSLDPNDPDFLKAKIGDWRLDLGAGSIGYLRVMFRLVAGFYRNFSGEGNSESDQPMSVASRFARGKLAPVPSYLADAAIGKTFNNEPFSPIGGIGERITPMFLHDLYEAWQAEGPMGGLKILPSAFGLGVSRYDEKPAKGGGLGVKMPEMPSMPEMPKLPGL